MQAGGHAAGALGRCSDGLNTLQAPLGSELPNINKDLKKLVVLKIAQNPQVILWKAIVQGKRLVQHALPIIMKCDHAQAGGHAAKALGQGGNRHATHIIMTNHDIGKD